MLPKIDLPIFETTLPSTGEKIKYRVFTVKEEKILLVASESNDPEQNVLAIKQVLNNCLIDTDASKLAMFDMEYMLLLIRARSVENGVKFSIVDPDTNEQVDLELDLDEVKVTKDPNHTNQVPINDDYVLFLRYPTIDEFIKIASIDPSDPLANYVIMISCLDKVASEDEVFEFHKYTQKEIDEFMEGISAPVVKGIQNFFDTMPKLRHEISYKNSNGDEKTFVIEGINSFFS
jgi:hypothetical protein